MASIDLLLKYFPDFSKTQIRQIEALEKLYREWNEKINLISRREIELLYERHVLHSLSIAAVFDFPSGIEIIDIGTGGGFPGIPLAIYFHEVQFCLVDSIGKKIKAVDEIIKQLNLKNVTIKHIRAEDIRNKKFHFTVSRAVASLNDLLKWSKKLLLPTDSDTRIKMPGFNLIGKIKNGLICLKGGNLEKEIEECKCNPQKNSIYQIFPEDYFKEKYLLYVPR